MNEQPQNPQVSAPIEGAGPVRIELLGGFSVTLADGRALTIATKKNRAMLAIMALSPGAQTTRDRLCGLLWGDRGEDQARSSLRQSLAVLRKELGEAEAMVLQTRDDVVGIRLGSVRVDTMEFPKLADANDLTSLRQAGELYRGEFLADNSIRDQSFDDWLSIERRRLAEKAISVFEKLSALETGHASVEAARRLVDFDPLREASHRALMRAHAQAGETALALQQYEACCSILKAEFGVEPAAETAQLRSEIVKGKIVPPKASLAVSVVEAVNHPVPPEDKPSIAVLPFANLNGDPGKDYICHGLTESIVSGLGRYHELFVIDWFSSIAYKDKSVGPAEAARELGVRFILHGSVQMSGGRIRVSVELAEGGDARQIWTNRYDRETNDIFAVQDEVTESVVAALMAGYGGRLRRAWSKRRGPASFERLEAMDYLQRALDGWDFTKEGTAVARELLGKAIERDPGFAKAHAKLAFTHMVDASFGFSDDYVASMRTARDFAVKAIAADDGDSWALWALAFHHMLSLRHDLALEEFRKALDCNPNDAEVMADYGLCLSYSGRAEEGIEAALKAMRLNPHHYDWYTAQLGQLYFDARRYDKAISTFAGLRELDTALMRVYQAASFAALGRMEDARAAVRRALELDPDVSLEKWGDVKLAPYGDTGYLEHFRTNLRQAGLPEKPPSSGTDKLAIAVLPFANLSSDPEQQYFAEGIAEDVITGLARFRHLAVVSRNASFRYRGDVDIKKAGQELGAAYLVEGSVRRLGEHLRITAQLIETQTLNHVWAESYDAPGSELFEAQDRLTRKIVATLGGRITDASVHHARLKPPGSLAAYELVLRANALNWDKAEAKVEVQRLLSMALDLEPDYALAHALMAAILVDQATDHARLTPAVFERAMTFASRAVELDKNDSASHSIAGWICLMRGDYDRGAAFIEGALRLNPNNPYAMINRACLHLLSGEPDAAIEVLERVWQVDPYFNPGWVEWYMSLAHFVAGRYAEVQVVVSRASQQSYFTMAVAAASKAALGDIAAARAWTAKALQLRPDCTIRAITSLAPFKLHRHHERLTSALREAGMPEMSWSHEQGEPEKPSIAILPFANLSGDPQQDYFADGVAEDIITELSRFSGLFVIARNSSFFFKGKNLGISAIAEQLGVKFIVEGSVRRSGNQIRVAVQLVDTDTGNEIWAERYDRSIDEIFAVQDEVVRTIVGTLEGRLAKNIAKQSSRKPTSSVLAYELVLQARDYLGTYDVQRAEPLLRKAIELDPGYAQALAWLAMVYWVKYFNDHKPSDINESLRVAKSAVAIDPDDSLCHAQYGYACLFSRQFDLADYHTGRAVELNPADMLSLSLRAHFYCRVGKSERTLEILDEVLRHDPFPPSWYWENRSIALLTLERYAEVIETIRRMQEIFWWDHAYLAVSYLHLGKLKEMKDSVAAAIKKRPDLNIEQMMKGEPYADTGDSERLIKGLRAAGFL